MKKLLSIICRCFLYAAAVYIVTIVVALVAAEIALYSNVPFWIHMTLNGW